MSLEACISRAIADLFVTCLIAKDNPSIALRMFSHMEELDFEPDALSERAGHGISLASPSLYIRPILYSIPKGPSGGTEALAFLECSVESQGFWYAYICQHPKRDCFVSMIVYLTAFVDALDPESLFARFDYWARKRLRYDPCIADGFTEVYREAHDFDSALKALQEMVHARRPVKSFDGPEMRIVDALGMKDFRNEDGVYPPCP